MMNKNHKSFICGLKGKHLSNQEKKDQLELFNGDDLGYKEKTVRERQEIIDNLKSRIKALEVDMAHVLKEKGIDNSI